MTSEQINPWYWLRWIAKGTLGNSRPWARGLCIVAAVGVGLISAYITARFLIPRCLDAGFYPDWCEIADTTPPWPLFTGLIAGPPAMLTWWWRTVHKDRDVDAAKRNERATRFFESIRLLADEKLDIRLGAIYSLESLAKEAPEDSHKVVEVVAAFLRHHGKPLVEAAAEPTVAAQLADVQTAFTVLGRMKRDGTRVDLSCANLASISATGGDYSHVNFLGADLRGAVFHNAKLDGANFAEARLK